MPLAQSRNNGPQDPEGLRPRAGKGPARSILPAGLRPRLIMIALLALAALAGMGALGLAIIHQSTRADMGRDAAFLTTLVRSKVDDMAEASRTLLRVIAAAPAVAGLQVAECNRNLAWLLSLPDLRRNYTGVIVLAPDLTPLCSSFEAPRLVDLAFFRQAAQSGEFVLGDYRVGEVSGIPILPAALPFMALDGSGPYLIGIGLRFSRLQQVLEGLELPPGAGIFVVDGEGRVVAARHPDGPENWIGRSVAGTALWKSAVSSGMGTYDGPGFDGVARIAGFRQASSAPGRLWVVATLPQDDSIRRMFGDTWAALTWGSGTIALLVLVLAGAGYLLIVRYVDRVAHAGQQLLDALPAALPAPPGVRTEGAGARRSRPLDLPGIAQAVGEALLHLRQREADLELSQQLAGVTTWRWSSDQPTIGVSANFREALDLPADLPLPATLDEYVALVAPEEREAVAAGLRRLLRDGEELAAEHRMILRDADGGILERQLILRGRALAEEGGIRHFVGALQDVTALRALERAYEREGTFLRTLLDSMDEGVLACDAEGMLVYANRKEEEIGGPLKPVHVDEVPAAYGIFKADGVTPLEPRDMVLGRALRGIAVDGETVVQAMPGRQRHTLRLTGRPIVDRSGVQLGAMIVQRDLTELLAVRDEVQDREEEFRQIFEASRDGKLVVRTDGEILLVNRAAEAVLGGGAGALAGRRLQQVMTALDERRMRALVQGVELGETVGLELETATLEGLPLAAELTGFPMRFRGKPAILVVIRDIAARREAEERLRGIQRLEVVGRLAGGIAHDFNNLLQVVILNIELLAAGLQQADPAREAADTALEAALRGSELTRHLQSYTLQQALEPRILDLDAAIRGARPLLARLLGEDILLREAFCEGPVWAITDPGQLDLVLSELAINARAAMPGGGTVTIGTAMARFDDPAGELEPGPHVLVTVSDDGEGMSPEDQARAFEPFFTTREIGHGSGLGLSMVFGFMKQCGGTVLLESEPGQGTTVTLCFPLAKPEDAGAQEQERPAGPVWTARVLVVEDDEDVRQMLCRHLAALGMSALEARSADEALARLEAGTDDIALVLSDIVMPGGMSGIDLAWQIRRRWPDLPVLLASGHVGRGSGKGVPPGVQLLRKPFRLAQLREAIEGSVSPHAVGDRKPGEEATDDATDPAD